MPFDHHFDDIYQFGIKGAAEEAGTYAERVDEQIFAEGILDRVFNQINKADVVVADMTGRNVNVYYEVGYAHALNKRVLLATQNADDIPFDLKHQPHTVYGGSIKRLKEQLGPRIKGALSGSKWRSEGGSDGISITLDDVQLPQGIASKQSPEISGTVTTNFRLVLCVRNDGGTPLKDISHVCLFYSTDANAVPSPAVESESFKASEADSRDGLTRQHRLPINFGFIPPGAIEQTWINFLMKAPECESLYRLRLCTANRFYDFGFRLKTERAEASNAPPQG